MKKALFIPACLISLFQIINAQDVKKVLFGSFVFERQVFQYQYKRDGNIHTLKLSTLAQPSPLGSLDSSKLMKTIAFLSAASKKDTIEKFKDSIGFLKTASSDTIEAIEQLPVYLTELSSLYNNKKIWKEHLEKVEKLRSILDFFKMEQIKIGDTVTKDIYNAGDLLTIYRNFLQNIAEPQNSQEIPFPELKIEEFQAIFLQELSQLYLNNMGESFSAIRDKVIGKAQEVMYEIKARADFKDDEPITAYMILKRKFIDLDVCIPVRRSNVRTTDTITYIKIRFEVKSIIVEFEDGAIKNIFADLLPDVVEYKNLYGNNTIRFMNMKPISIIGKFDPNVFVDQWIFAGNATELKNCLFNEAKRQKPDSVFVEGDFINGRIRIEPHFVLSNLVDYKVVSEMDNEDYSPANSKIELSEPTALIALKKEKRSRILTARAYTDFMGLSGEQPNGLVQIEVSKRINIVSGRSGGFFQGFYSKNTKGIYSGGFSFIEPRFTVSKIEEDKRFLSLDSNLLDRQKSFLDSTNHFLVNPLEVLHFQQWSFGVDVNIYKLSLHNRKSNFQINGSFSFGRTSAIDSVKISENKILPLQSANISRVSTTTYGFGIVYELKPDSRYGLSLGYDFRWQDLASTRFEYNQLFKSYYHTAWFNGFFKVSDDSRLFWRFRKYWLSKNGRYNFYQIQLGFELDIFKTSN